MKRDEYLRNVGWWLRDLPWSTRRDLLAELRGHLDELPPDTDFRAKLGPPEAYASDLRAAAGLERRRGAVAFLRARRPRNLILVVLALTAAGLAIGAVAWIDSYQPIVYGNATQTPLDSKPSAGQPGVTVVFRKGRPFLYGVTIRNSGRFPVRILGVPRDVTDFFKGRLLINKPNPAENELPLERFRPERPAGSSGRASTPAPPGWEGTAERSPGRPSRFDSAFSGEPRQPSSQPRTR